MLKLSMETSAATSKAPLMISSTRSIRVPVAGAVVPFLTHASNVTGIAVGERKG